MGMVLYEGKTYWVNDNVTVVGKPKSKPIEGGQDDEKISNTLRGEKGV